MKVQEVIDKYPEIYELVTREYQQYSTKQVIAFILTTAVITKDVPNVSLVYFFGRFTQVAIEYECEDPLMRMFVNNLIDQLED
ncbi:hypothetical protein TRFO_38164 [Tritrichomonas foetus]|uniref:Uncharacterized protein n=1 Tax=Tritrichomonas foetus TaxID=1144522 RepID=A0A1J4J963_9EUKA|nr:hypothetical protein TRFO_38164 [Tritrichomonas foetus]|eukprot:OHS95688.1 hypothetical protein TRFO_38164 [Tritrichomonas foetus]